MSTIWEVRLNNSAKILTHSSQQVENLAIINSSQQSYQSAAFQIHDIDDDVLANVELGADVVILINSSLEFEGIISYTNRIYTGVKYIDVQCVGNTFELTRYYTAEDKSYTNKATGYIVKDLCDTYAIGMFDHSTISTTDGVTVQSITFDGEDLHTCITRLSELDGFNFYVGNATVVS